MMDKYLQKLQHFKDDVQNQTIKDPHAMQKQMLYFAQNAPNLDSDSMNEALKLWDELIVMEKINPMIRSMFAMIAGSMIESGKANPMIVLKSIINLLMGAAVRAKPIVEVYQQHDKLTQEQEKKNEPTDEELSRMNPDAFFAWKILDQIWLPTKAVLSMSKEARMVLKQLPNFQVFSDILQSYRPYHSGCNWVYTALNIFDGELLVFHPQTKKGFKVYAESIEHPFSLGFHLTNLLVGDPEKGMIPAQPNKGKTQFWQFNWKVVSELMEGTDYDHMHEGKWNQDSTYLMRKSPAYIGSESKMDELLYFEGTTPILIIIDTGIVSWSFPTEPSFREISPKISLIEILDQNVVKDWLIRLVKSVGTVPNSH